MVLLAKLQPLLGIFEFCAFILRHQSAIDAKVVGLVFDNNTAQLANHISITLSGCEQKCFNTDLTNIKFVGLDCDLIIQFGVQNSKYIAKRSLKARSIILLMSDEPIPLVNILPRVPDYVSINYNELVVNLHHNPITFITSTFKSWRLAHIKATSEVELVRSFDWLAFLCHVKKLPTGEFLRVFDDSFEVSNGLANNVLHPSQPHPKTDNRIAFISGFNVGMYKIIAERLSSNLLIIQNLVSEADYNQRFSRLPSTNLQDHRLSWRYWKYRRPVSKFTISLTSPHAVAIYTFARAKRYRILVPRIVLESSSANNMFMTLRKCGVILGILLVTGIFVALRLFCQWTVTKLSRHYGSSYLVHSFFDTFSQLLGISSSDSLREASSSECQLLIVVGFFAILSSGIFSGVLYEDHFIEHKLSFKYNSLDDICREGLDVGVPLEWYLYFKMENYNCTPILITHKDIQPNGAFIIDEVMLPDIDYISQGYMALKIPFAILPDTISSNVQFLEQPIQKLVVRCVEHGIWAALMSAANHLQTICRNHHCHVEMETPTAKQDIEFVYWFLVFGLFTASIVFCVEILCFY